MAYRAPLSPQHSPVQPSAQPEQEFFCKLPHKLMRASHWVSRTTGELISLTASDKLLWVWMKDRHDYFTSSGGTWHDNQESIARACGVSVPTVKRWVSLLKAHGYMVVVKRGLSNSYSLLADLHTSDQVGVSTSVADAANDEAPVLRAVPRYEKEDGEPF